jgi:hypothetical protein
MTLKTILRTLEKQRRYHEKETDRIKAALLALRGVKGGGRRALSASARKRIGAAQRARWAKVRAKARKTKIRKKAPQGVRVQQAAAA